MAACSGGETYDPVVYTSKDSGGNTYKLTITKNTGKAAFTPGTGDFYSLTITYAAGTTQISTGTVKSYSSTVISFENAASVSFTVTITSNGTMTKIEGTIPVDNGGTVPAPGTITPNNPDGGTTPPAANLFANTSWLYSGEVGGALFADGSFRRLHGTVTLSFGTDTWTVVMTPTESLLPPNINILEYNWGKPTGTQNDNGTYTANGNTAILNVAGKSKTMTATISGNTLTLEGLVFTKQ
jgi:hypothetical protein